MKIKKFLQEDDGAIAVEYIILVAIAAILLIAGVTPLMKAMSGFFKAWGTYFGAGS
jgi:Flp pilus assembly pilin Flp